MADQDVLEFQPNNTALESYVKEEKYTKQKTGTVFYEKYRKRHFFSHQRKLWPRKTTTATFILAQSWPFDHFSSNLDTYQNRIKKSRRSKFNKFYSISTHLLKIFKR